MTMRKQTGRSMIEMLGILAIIGMLAIGGVWGIRKAFTKHNANNLIEDVRLAGFIVVDEMLETVLNADGDVTLNDKITPQTNYSFKAFAEENSTTTFGILAQNVPFNVCEEVSARKVDWLEEIRPNGLENVCKEDNEISFFFNTELGKYPELEGNTCRSDRDCANPNPYCGNNGRCQSCIIDEHCSDEAAPYCRGGQCAKCPELQVGYNQACEACPAINATSDQVTRISCHNGCGANYFYSSGGGIANSERACTGCEYKGIVQTPTPSECKRCPNRYYDPQTNNCKLCPSEQHASEDGLSCE